MNYDAMIETDPWAVMMLAFEVGQDNMDEDLQDAVRKSAMVIAAVTLVSGGMDIEDVERQFFEREWGVKLTYDFATEELGMEIEWAEHPIMSIRRVE